MKAGEIKGGSKKIFPENQIYIVLIVLLSAASIVPIWIVEYFPSQNGPAFLNIIHMFKEMNSPDYVYNDYFMRHLHYMPYLPMYGLIYVFSFFCPLLVANKLFLSLIVLLFPTTVFYFVSRKDPLKIIFGFPAYLIVYNFGFMRGYYNFFIAILFLILFITKWYEFKDSLNLKRIVSLNALLLCVFISHLIVTVFLFFILFLTLLLEGKRIREIAAHFVKISLPVVISMAYFIWFSSTQSIWHNEAIIIEDWWFKTENIYLRFLWPYSHFGKLVALVPFLIILLSLIKDKGDFSLRYIKKKEISIANSSENRNILVLMVIIFLYYLFPWKFMGWHKADAHLIIFMFIFFLACPRGFKQVKSRMAFVSLNFVLSVFFFCHVGAQVVQLDHEIKEEFLAGMPYLAENSKMLSISAGGNHHGVVNPYAHLQDYYALYKGMITGKSLAAYNTISPVWYRAYREFPNFSNLPIFNAGDLNRENLGTIRDTYDYVLVWGNFPDLGECFKNNGFIPVFEKKRLHLFEPGAIGRGDIEFADPEINLYKGSDKG